MQFVWTALLLALVGLCHTQIALRSPCPDVFKYQLTGCDPGRWDGTVTIYNNTIYPLSLNIVLDNKAELLWSWAGDVTTTDYIDFKIGINKMSFHPLQAMDIGFYVKYISTRNVPRVAKIEINGVEICNVTVPMPVSDRLVFYNGKEISKNTIRRKREYSWMSEISRKPVTTKPFTQMSTDIKQNSWTWYISGMRPGPPSSQPVYPAPNPVRPSKRPVTPKPTVPGPQPDSVDQVKCGTLATEIASALVVGGTRTVPGQWPWQVALYHSESVNSEFFCAGTLVSQRHVVTSAHCVTEEDSTDPVETNTLSVHLGRHNLHSTTRGVQIKFVEEIIVHPQYNVTILAQNVGILRLLEPVRYTELVRPACLWPEDKTDLSSVIGKIGTVVGWGTDITNESTEELMQVEMPVVEPETCIRSYSAFFGTVLTDTTFCAGRKDGTAPCNGDGGSGMVMKMDNTWYLRGLVSLSVSLKTDFCDPSHYVVFTDLAKFETWIKENIR